MFFYLLIFFFIALFIIHIIQLKEREYFECSLDGTGGGHDCFKENQSNNNAIIKEANKKDSKLVKSLEKIQKQIENNRTENDKISDHLKTQKEEAQVE